MKYTLAELAQMDIEYHRRWKEACAYHMSYRHAPPAPDGKRRPKQRTSMGAGMKAAGENARYLHKAWANIRDMRIAAGGARLKYPKYTF